MYCVTLVFLITKETEQPFTSKSYSAIIGMLQWVANGTHPNIQFLINYLSQFLSWPTYSHWHTAVRVLRYFNTTKFLCFCLGNSTSEGLVGYSDVDWVLTVIDRRSTTGCICKYGGESRWKFRRQLTVAQSTTNGKYMAMTDAAKEEMWLPGFTEYLGGFKGKYNPLLQQSRCGMFVNRSRVTSTNQTHQC